MREPGDGEGQGHGKRRKPRAPRPSPSDFPPAERAERAYEAALRLLNHRERSRAELRIRLRSKGYDGDTIEGVLDRLTDAGLQDDRRFAELFTAEAHRSRGLSSSAVRGELRRRGVERDLAAEAATEPPEEEAARALEQATRRARRLGGLAPEVRHRRLVAFLGRRGYGREVSERAAAQALGGDVDPASPGETDDDGPPDFPLS